MYQRVKQAKLLKILIQEQALVRLLKTIGDKEYHTRELLKKMGAYGYGHKLLIKAERIGLVERRTNKNRMYNTLTKKGKEVIKLAHQIGV
jgi:histone acetyltransferase (RNA polymerase elongator complex component)